MPRSWGKLRRSLHSSSSPKSTFQPSRLGRDGNLDITGDSGVSGLSTDTSPTQDQSLGQLNICKFFGVLDFFWSKIEISVKNQNFG